MSVVVQQHQRRAGLVLVACGEAALVRQLSAMEEASN